MRGMSPNSFLFQAAAAAAAKKGYLGCGDTRMVAFSLIFHLLIYSTAFRAGDDLAEMNVK